ncbi:aspartate/glutamate racemase family protein [Janthinobacterium sp. MDT1-19]|uniref:aspartate/glutamate racemase family protein n=1 Tax=Janthinobacterium sp. MDT1-19 TaxID=1259339 RepID=UPI003F1F8D18
MASAFKKNHDPAYRHRLLFGRRAALCYRTICEEGAHALGAYEHPQVTLHTPPLARHVECLKAGDLAGVAELMLASAHKLAAAGADFLICPDNTIHQAFELMAPRAPLPWLHIADVVAGEAAERGCRRVGLTGTCWLVDSAVYPRSEINRILMEALVQGVVRPDSVARFQAIIGGLQEQGCDAALRRALAA